MYQKPWLYHPFMLRLPVFEYELGTIKCRLPTICLSLRKKKKKHIMSYNIYKTIIISPFAKTLWLFTYDCRWSMRSEAVCFAINAVWVRDKCALFSYRKVYIGFVYKIEMWLWNRNRTVRVMVEWRSCLGIAWICFWENFVLDVFLDVELISMRVWDLSERFAWFIIEMRWFFGIFGFEKIGDRQGD